MLRQGSLIDRREPECCPVDPAWKQFQNSLARDGIAHIVLLPGGRVRVGQDEFEGIANARDAMDVAENEED